MPTRPVYLHGLGGSPDDWRPVQLRQAGLALALDSGADNPFEAAVDLAERITKQVSTSFALCGYSMGGRLAILAAQELIARKKKPDGLVLLSTGFGAENEDARAARRAADEGWAALAEKSRDEFWQKWYEQEIFASFARLPEETRASWLENRKAIDVADLTGQFRRLGPAQHDDLFPVLRRLAAGGLRVLYLAGSLDKKYSELAEKLRGLPGITVDVISGAGHILPLEAPEALALRIRKFVQ